MLLLGLHKFQFKVVFWKSSRQFLRRRVIQMRLWIAFCSALVISTWVQAELIGVSRDTKLNASASAGAITDNKTTHETTFADFDQTLSAGAAASGATGSATAPQQS